MVFPFQPKLKLCPQSSTLPLGTVYTLTAAVTDLGDPENPLGLWALAMQSRVAAHAGPCDPPPA